MHTLSFPLSFALVLALATVRGERSHRGIVRSVSGVLGCSVGGMLPLKLAISVCLAFAFNAPFTLTLALPLAIPLTNGARSIRIRGAARWARGGGGSAEAGTARGGVCITPGGVAVCAGIGIG